jgi:septal ring-binding cell division protein DamX
MRVSKAKIITLFTLVLAVLVIEILLAFFIQGKKELDCNDYDAASRVIIQNAKDVCPNGWTGRFEMDNGKLGAECEDGYGD